MREIRTLRARRRGLETEPRITLAGHEAGNRRHRQGISFEQPRQSSTLPRLRSGVEIVGGGGYGDPSGFEQQRRSNQHSGSMPWPARLPKLPIFTNHRN